MLGVGGEVVALHELVQVLDVRPRLAADLVWEVGGVEDLAGREEGQHGGRLRSSGSQLT